MTTAALAKLMNRRGQARLSASGSGHGVLVDVWIRDAKTAFGRTDVLVEPVAGLGRLWMSLENVELDGPPAQES